MTVLIRKAIKKDIEEIYNCFLDMAKSEDTSTKKIDRAFMLLRQRRKDFVTSSKKELLREIRERNSLYLVAEENKCVVGYAYGTIKKQKSPFFVTKTIGYFNALVVRNRYRGKGIASKLRNELENWFKIKKCKLIYLEVVEQNNAKEIYKKWGYKNSNLVMVKRGGGN
ncbi:GNAT family N-acetyltransferase [Candidatus Woesearchaeota archaeon]|jgi:ribosomal protein S18 acetylase RimI-like enzyme|nr:GNAT family N-acetyltransferase [Candidatus Woesearchaeota archaeon]MBT6520097.1 GNAT family N-acetyltransferase [Candidatus Woesearchaeota archaeon]MBT7366702.1 GNAT family N-acetyltransferase [Candidatus Woesearchaeota archaeon]